MPMVGKKKFSYTKLEKWQQKNCKEKRYENEIKDERLLMLTSKQKTLPPALKKKILASKMKKKKKECQKKVQ